MNIANEHLPDCDCRRCSQAKVIRKLTAQRDELLAALEKIKAHLDHGIHDADWQWGVEAYDIARAAIYKAKSE